jgi:hypothetical protein
MDTKGRRKWEGEKIVEVMEGEGRIWEKKNGKRGLYNGSYINIGRNRNCDNRTA